MDNVFLTGFMASGKTAVGRMLARRLGWRFLDLDSEIEHAAALPVPQIFARFGEAEFRRRESQALERASAGVGSVIATGGGAVVDPENRRRMRARGVIVRLAASPDDILVRVGDGSSRPLLAGARSAEERRERIVRLLEERGAAYADADTTVETSGRPVSDIVETIARWIGTAEAAPRGERA